MMTPPPIELHEILEILQASLLPATLQAAQSQLEKQLEVSSSYVQLQEIFSRKEYDLGPYVEGIRRQAVIQFKNGVEKYWRRGANHAISQRDKEIIRPKLLAMVDEPDRVIAKIVALCIGKIARLDYGVDWAELPDSLLTSLQEGLSMPPLIGHLRLHRSLLILHATIKALSSNRMQKGRLLMMEMCSLIFPSLVHMHTIVLTREAERLQTLGRAAATGPGSAEGEMELAHLGFKVLSKFAIYGFRDPSADEGAKAFFLSTMTGFQKLFHLRTILLPPRSEETPPTDPFHFLSKHVLSYGKLYRSMIKHDANLFQRMGAADEILNMYWLIVQGAAKDVTANVSDSLSAPYPEKLVVQALLLLLSGVGDGLATSPLLDSLPPTFVTQFADILVSKIIPLRQDDLEKWEEDPEAWMNEEEAERWEFELRPCAEHVLTDLVSQYSAEVSAPLAVLLQRVSAPHDMSGLLLKEAVYCAFGRNPSGLKEAIKFEEWLDHTLVVEAAGTDSSYRIIRRRIAWLVGNWVGEDLTPSARTKIYALLLHLLGRNASTDTAIRLTAARSLAKCDTWDFQPEAFVPFLPQTIEELVQLLGEVSLPDSQMRINQSLGVVIDRVGAHIAPYAAKLAEVLAVLWASAREPHFQTSVLVTFSKLVEALGPESQGLQAQAAPIISYSVDPASSAHIYLQEDALELWQALLRRSATLSPEMIALLPMLVTLLRAGTDVMPRVISILESYLFLDGPRVLQLCSGDLFSAFHFLLGELKYEATKAILHSIDTIFQAAPIEIWAQSFDSSCLLEKLMAQFSLDVAVVVTRYLGTISRLILAGPTTFFPLLTAAAARLQQQPTDLISAVLRQYFDKLDNMGQASQRKLTALALASLLPSGEAVLMQELPELVSLWSSVLAETEEDESGDAEVYQDTEYDEGIGADYSETLETARRQAFISRDPVRAIKLNSFISARINEAQAMWGGAEAFQTQWLVAVDPLLLNELSRRLDGTLAG